MHISFIIKALSLVSKLAAKPISNFFLLYLPKKRKQLPFEL